MRAILALAAAASVLASPVAAIQRYNADRLSCAEIRGIIRDDGAAIMRYRSKMNPSLVLYDRYVRDRFFCTWREDAVRAWIPSNDRERCGVLKCDTPIRWPHDPFRRGIDPQ